MAVTTSRGLSLVEVLVAMVVLTIGVLGLAPLIMMSIYGNTFSNDVTVANGLANREMESLISQSSYGSVPYVSVTDSVDGVFRVYKTVEDNSCNGSVPPGVYKLSIAVSWTDRQGIKRSSGFSAMKPQM
jgi:prepilin-type N-terminal cleavage/methylation domain-containing protein